MKMKKLPSEANSEQGDLSGEGRLGETCKPMDKNRIEGRHGTTSWHNAAKSSGLPVEVNVAVVQGSIAFLPGEISTAQAEEKSADAIVVGDTSRSAECTSKLPEASPNEGPNCMAGVLTAWRTVNPPKTPDGEVEPRAATMGSMWAFRIGLRLVSSRGLGPRLCGTAVYGPVRTVVWDPWLTLRVSHGDPIRPDSPLVRRSPEFHTS
jgi:hypothetical protein